jgi:hypothetical protein
MLGVLIAGSDLARGGCFLILSFLWQKGGSVFHTTYILMCRCLPLRRPSNIYLGLRCYMDLIFLFFCLVLTWRACTSLSLASYSNFIAFNRPSYSSIVLFNALSSSCLVLTSSVLFCWTSRFSPSITSCFIRSSRSCTAFSSSVSFSCTCVARLVSNKTRGLLHSTRVHRLLVLLCVVH